MLEPQQSPTPLIAEVEVFQIPDLTKKGRSDGVSVTMRSSGISVRRDAFGPVCTGQKRVCAGYAWTGSKQQILPRPTPTLEPDIVHSDHLQKLSYKPAQDLRNFTSYHTDTIEMLSLRPALTSASFAAASLRRSTACYSSNILRSYSTATDQLATLSPLSDIAKSELGSTSPYDEHISVLTLNRAPAKNAISRALLAEMDQHVSSLLTSSTVRTLLIRSTVPGTFCAGADLKERKGMSKPEVDAFLLGLRKVFTNVSRLPMPTIACLDGLAMGGGLELALTCDLRIAGPAATKLGLTETKLGIIPGAGGTSRMTRLVGPARAKEMIFSAKLVDAVEASRIGFVDIVAQEGDGTAAFSKGVQLARSFAKNGKSRGTHPPTISPVLMNTHCEV